MSSYNIYASIYNFSVFGFLQEWLGWLKCYSQLKSIMIMPNAVKIFWQNMKFWKVAQIFWYSLKIVNPFYQILHIPNALKVFDNLGALPFQKMPWAEKSGKINLIIPPKTSKIDVNPKDLPLVRHMLWIYSCYASFLSWRFINHLVGQKSSKYSRISLNQTPLGPQNSVHFMEMSALKKV